MIRDYETAMVLWLHDTFPYVKNIQIGNEEMLTFSLPKIVYPSILIKREEDDWVTNNIITVYEHPKSTNLFRYTQNYEGRFLLEKQVEAINLSGILRFRWFKNPFLYLRYNDSDLKVSLWLKYIKVESVRDNANEKGPRREVKFAWKSELFFDEDFDVEKYKGVKFIVDANNENKFTIEYE